MRSISLIGLLVVVGCGARDPGNDPDAGGVFTCDDDSDCDDGADCTIDTCIVGGTCSFMAVDALCEDGESCLAGRGCVAGTPCDDAADCDDAIACTIDSCGVDRMCRHMALDDLCDDPAAPSCDPAMGCVRGSGCTSAAECDDSIACTVDACGADMTCRHTPVNGECATGEVCSLTMGCYTPRPCTTAAECDDGVFCNGVEQCVPEFGCAEAAAPRACSDSDDCTVDSCDSAADMCVFACDSTRSECGCGPPPEACSGRFAVTGDTGYECLCELSGIPLGECMSGYDFSEVTFMNLGVALRAQPLRYWTTSTGLSREYRDLVLSDTMEPVCPNFDASYTIAGDCAENYRLSGTFTDMDHFTGRIERSYTGAMCADYGCVAGSADVEGTRIP